MKEPTSRGGEPEETGRPIGSQAAAQNGQVASEDQTGVEVQVEGGRPDFPDQQGGNGDVVSQVADLVQEEFIDKLNAADEKSEGDDEEDGQDNVQEDHGFRSPFQRTRD